jgi:hypothetical protein
MKKVILLVALLFAISNVASAAIITSVDRSGGASGDRDHIGVYDGEMDPEASAPGGLQTGVYIFSDRDYLYGGIPIELVGAEYIVTYNSDKSFDGSVTYAVTLSSPCFYAIAVDDRFGDQQGMVDGIAAGVVAAGTFTDTGLDLITGEDTPRNLSVFSAPLPAGTHTFVGYGFGGSNNFMVMGAQIPEPATLALLGFGGLAMLRRKR